MCSAHRRGGYLNNAGVKLVLFLSLFANSTAASATALATNSFI